MLVLGTGAVAAQTVNCTLSTTPMAFGTYDPASPTRLGPVTAAVNVQCSVPPGSGNVAGFTMNVDLSPGAGSYGQRQMTTSPGTDRVNYNIFTSAAATSIWGNGTAGTARVTLTIGKMTPGQSGNASATAYGFVPGSQPAVGAGSYADTIVVTAIW